MASWILMFFSNLIVPVVLMSFGSSFRNNPPGQINALFGYRTNRSTKNQDTWVFANKLWGDLAWKSGIWMLIGSVAAMIAVFFAGENVVAAVGTILMLLQVAVIVATIPIVERALKKEFDKDGNRRR